MKHPYLKWMIGELVFIGLALLFGILTILLFSFFLLWVTILFLFISLICDGMMRLSIHQSTEAIKPFVRSLSLVFIMIYLIFH